MQTRAWVLLAGLAGLLHTGCTTASDADAAMDSGPDTGGPAADAAARDADADVRSPDDDGANDEGDADAAMDAAADDGSLADAGDGSVDDGGDAGPSPSDVCPGLTFATPGTADGAAVVSGLGQDGSPAALFRDGNRLLASGPTGYVLRDIATGREVASGTSGTALALSSARFILATSTAIEIRATSDGTLAATITLPPGDALGRRLGAPDDASYVWATTDQGLWVWSASGQLITNVSGSYSLARVGAATDALHIVQGPAGDTVIESVSVPGGARTTSSAFAGRFAAWSSDGTYLVATVGSTNLAVLNPDATQRTLIPITSVISIGAGGRYVWVETAGRALSLYDIAASGVPTENVVSQVTDVYASHGHAVLASGDPSVAPRVLDLTVPNAVVRTTLLEGSRSSMATADANGAACAALGDGTLRCERMPDDPAPARLGCSRVSQLAGSAASSVVAFTLEGDATYVVDIVRARVLATLPITNDDSNFPVRGLQLSDDGSTLAILGRPLTANPALPAAGLYVARAPSWAIDESFGPSDAERRIETIMLAANGHVVSRGEAPLTAGNGATRVTTVTALDLSTATPSPVVTQRTATAGRLSPDGTRFALANGDTDSSSDATRLYAGGELVAAVPGVPCGWLGPDAILVRTSTFRVLETYAESKLYTGAGELIATWSLPGVRNLQRVDNDTFLGLDDGCLYDSHTGATSSCPGGRAPAVLAGAYVLKQSGTTLRAYPRP